MAVRQRGERCRGSPGFHQGQGGKKGLKRCRGGDNKDFGTDTPAGSQLGGSFPHRSAGIAGLNVLKGPN